MASTTLANQNSTLSFTQRLSISIEVEQSFEIEIEKSGPGLLSINSSNEL